LKGKVKLKLKPVKTKVLLLPPAGTVQEKLKCPGGYVPTAPGGEEKVPGITPKTKARAALSIPSPGQAARWTTVMPVKGGFQFTVHNPTAQAKDVQGSAQCAKRKGRYRASFLRGRAKIKVTRVTSQGTAAPSSFGSFVERCRKRNVPISGGWSYPPDRDVLFTGTETTRRHRFQWNLLNGTPQAQDIDLFLLCTRGKVKFDRGRP
jgi:hypothetical protein